MPSEQVFLVKSLDALEVARQAMWEQHGDIDIVPILQPFGQTSSNALVSSILAWYPDSQRKIELQIRVALRSYD